MLSGQLLLETWERGVRQHPVDRALTMLAGSFPGTAGDTMADWSVGTRDAALLHARRQAFGSRLHSMADCPACGEQLEFVVDVADLLVKPTAIETEPFSALTCEGYVLEFRLPTSKDLGAIVGVADATAGRRQIIERCVRCAAKDSLPVRTAELPDAVLELLAARIAERDPQAELQLDLTCPSCGEQWQSLFDIEEFFWTEICVQAKRLLREVHSLARAYGWGERDILSMTGARRHMYLEMVSDG